MLKSKSDIISETRNIIREAVELSDPEKEKIKSTYQKNFEETDDVEKAKQKTADEIEDIDTGKVLGYLEKMDLDGTLLKEKKEPVIEKKITDIKVVPDRQGWIFEVFYNESKEPGHTSPVYNHRYEANIEMNKFAESEITGTRIEESESTISKIEEVYDPEKVEQEKKENLEKVKLLSEKIHNYISTFAPGVKWEFTEEILDPTEEFSEYVHPTL